MSEHGVYQESDRVPGRKALALTVLFVLVIAGGGWWAWLLLNSETRRDAATPIPAGGQVAGGAAAADPLRTSLLGADSSTRAMMEDQRRSLERYGWVDSARGIASIPIEQAMRIVAARIDAADTTSLAQPAGGPPPPDSTAARDTTAGGGA